MAVFMVAVFGLVSQIISQQSASVGSVSNTFDETAIVFDDTTSDSAVSLPSTRRYSLGIGAYVRMVLVLFVILVLIYFVLRFFKKYAGLDTFGSGTDTFLRRVASLQVGQGKSVQVVTLIDKAYLIGVSDNSVNLISEINDEEMISALNLYADKNSSLSRPKSFAEVLDLFMPNSSKNATSKNIFDSDDSEDIIDALKNRKLSEGDSE